MSGPIVHYLTADTSGACGSPHGSMTIVAGNVTCAACLDIVRANIAARHAASATTRPARFTHHTRVGYLAKIMAARVMDARLRAGGVVIPRANWSFARELYRGWLEGPIRDAAPCPIPEPSTGGAL